METIKNHILYLNSLSKAEIPTNLKTSKIVYFWEQLIVQFKFHAMISLNIQTQASSIKRFSNEKSDNEALIHMLGIFDIHTIINGN